LSYNQDIFKNAVTALSCELTFASCELPLYRVRPGEASPQAQAASPTVA